MVLLALSGCSATRSVAEWRSPDYAPQPIDHLMIIGIADSATERRLFEDLFTAELVVTGTRGISSWTVMPEQQKLGRDTVVSAMEASDADAVLITHMVGVEEREIYHPPRTVYQPVFYGYGYYDYYSSVYDYVYQPGYYTRHRFVKLETNLYEAGGGDLVWSMQSETMDPDTPEVLIRESIKAVIQRLKRHGMIRG